MPRRTTPMIDRLMERVVPEGDCWRFTGAINATGYGVIGRGTRGAGNALTHRAAYEHFIAEIPEGLDLDHLCRNRWCCNPWHMEPVSRIVNVSRGLRAPGYRLSHCRRGHEFTPDNTLTHRSGDRIQRKCRTCTAMEPSRLNRKKAVA